MAEEYLTQLMGYYDEDDDMEGDIKEEGEEKTDLDEEDLTPDEKEIPDEEIE